MKYRKLNKIQKKADRDARVREAMHGEGVYVYANNTKGDLYLPKPTHSGKRVVKVGEEFQGDSYYITLVKTNQLKLIKELVAPPQKEGANMSEQKLILDQPDRVTQKGTVEQVLPAAPQQLNEGQPTKQAPKQEVLINEDPMDGVEILLN